jgi:hypothetical protein
METDARRADDLRGHAQMCLRLAHSLRPGEGAEEMERLALAYLDLAERLDEAAIASAAASSVAALGS